MSFEEIRELNVPLAEKLEAYSDDLRYRRPATAEAYDEMVVRLQTSGAVDGALGVGDTLPAFVLTDHEGRLVSSAALLGKGPLVISFNRGHWCSFCNLELAALADAYDDIRAAGADLVSIMPERASRTRTLEESIPLPFRVLTDLDNGYALRCGLMVSLGEKVLERLSIAGINIADAQGNLGGFVPIPATYVVAPDRRIIACGVDEDFRRRFPVCDILKSLGAQLFGCPI